MSIHRIAPALVCLACLLAGCAHGPKDAEEAQTPGPFNVTLDAKASWPAGAAGYDQKLPGYPLVGDIASARFDAKGGKFDGRSLVIAIKTSPGMAANLEFVEVATEDLIVDSRLAPGMNEELHDPRSWTPHKVTGHAERGTYLNVSVVGHEVLVELTPKMLEHVRKGFTIKWIDWYR